MQFGIFSDQRFFFELTPFRQVHFLHRKISLAPTTYKNGSPLKMFVLKRGLIPDTSSEIAIVVGSICKFCALVNLSGTCPNCSISLPIGPSNSHLSSYWSIYQCHLVSEVISFSQKNSEKKKWIVAPFIPTRIGRGKKLIVAGLTHKQIGRELAITHPFLSQRLSISHKTLYGPSG